MITGANSGFGRALTELAISRGDTVAAIVRRPETMKDLLGAHPDQLDVVALDVTDISAVEAVAADVVARHGRVDVLVNNAGRTHVGSVEETSLVELRELFDVQFFGAVALTRALLPQFRERGSGAIVQMSSIGGQLSFAGFGAYSATKSALEGLSEALAAELAPYGVRVLIVEPGAFRTSLFTNGGSSAPMSAYSGTVGETRAMIANSDGAQVGDPAKAASAILTALEAGTTPLRLALGEDAVVAIAEHSVSLLADLRMWEAVSLATVIQD
jgi:NAD(P)-dependent dehydrogenase (short-subunit alcohol dehydrogenase family)